MIKVRDLTVHYGAVRALEGVSLTVDPGEFVLVTGPSGCGKSTLARALAGLIPQALSAQMQGCVHINGLDTRQHPISKLAETVGVVFQNPASQLFHLRVEEEIACGPRNLGLVEEEVGWQVDWALEAAAIKDLRHANPAELSGGQKQRVAVACALAMRPRVLVLDEPTASLDVLGSHKVMQTLEELRQSFGVTIVLIEHRLADSVRLADRVVLMEGGQIIADGKTSRVLADPHIRERLGLRRPTRRPMSGWRTLIRVNGGRSKTSPPLLSMRNVSTGYGRHAVIRDLDIDLYAGDFAAVVGENGAGKSTLGLLAAGMLKPWQGEVCFRDRKRPRPGLDVAMLFQNPCDQLFTDNVDEEVGFAALNYGLSDEKRHGEVLEEADLYHLRRRRPQMLSVGQQQRVALAACLTVQPQLVILDEPTLGQDWGHLQRMMNYLTRLNQLGKAILLITHDYKLIHRYAQRIILMKAGRIVSDGRLRSPGKESAY